MDTRMKSKRCTSCGAVIHAYRQMCPHCKHDMRPVYYKHPVLTGLVIANILMFMIFAGTSVSSGRFVTGGSDSVGSDSGNLTGSFNRSGVVAGLFSGGNNSDKLEPYEIVSEKDSSIPGCSRMVYKIVIDNRVPRADIEPLLVDLYNKKKDKSEKVFIYAFAEADAGNVDDAIYRARLFMDPSCDVGNQYAIDYRL